MNEHIKTIKNFSINKKVNAAADLLDAELERLKKDNEILSDMLRLVKAESMKRLERIEKLEGGENGDAQTDSINGVNNASSTS